VPTRPRTGALARVRSAADPAVRVMHFYTMNLEKVRRALLLLLLLRDCVTDDDAPRMHVQATVAVLRNLGAAHEVPADVADA
jgi:hypothetical protein